MRLNIFKVLCLTILMGVCAQAKTTKVAPSKGAKKPAVTKGQSEAVAQAEKILKKYAQSSGFKMDVKKTDEKKALGTSQVSQGKVVFSKSKFNLELMSDKKTEIIYNGQKIWLIEYPDTDFDPKGKRKVTVLTNGQPLLTKQFISLFSDPKKLFKEFKVLDFKNENKKMTIRFKSTQKSVKNFQVVFDTDPGTVSEVQFTDDVDTKTTLAFSPPQFLKTAPKDGFKYKALKNDEVVIQ